MTILWCLMGARSNLKEWQLMVGSYVCLLIDIWVVFRILFWFMV